MLCWELGMNQYEAIANRKTIAAAGEGVFGVIRIPGEDERAVMKEFLGLLQGYEIFCSLALGYPAEDAKRARQVEIDLDERVHMNAW